MFSPKILIVSGTHGNEINPIWAVNQFRQLKNNARISNLIFTLGNPEAISQGLRYVDVDLNRSFHKDKINLNENSYEIRRAAQLVKQYGSKGLEPCQIVFDLHTTTASMGTSIVMYGRREKDFCLAAILQNKFGLPVYLHENDSNQTGFLVESWESGLVIEIGSVAQNFYDYKIIERFLIILDFISNLGETIQNRKINFPREITLHIHQKSIDYPRDKDLNINALIHPQRTNKDWIKIKSGDPLFLDMNGKTIFYEEENEVYPVFIGEVAYREKNIAMSFTEKKTIKCSKEWIDNFLNFQS